VLWWGKRGLVLRFDDQYKPEQVRSGSSKNVRKRRVEWSGDIPGLSNNRIRLCERSEPQSYPVVGRARYWHATCYKKISFFRAIIVKITWDMRELRKTYKIVRFYSLCSILGYFFTHCQVFLSNSHYALGFVSRYCVSGILPRFFAVGKPLPQG
jgi:hypothetical protein